MLGNISHEFVHIRQMFCGIDYDKGSGKKTHREDNPIIKQLNNKEKFKQAVRIIPGITEECREMIYRCFYLFTKTELDARIDASTKHLNSKEKIQELLDDYTKERTARKITGDAPNPFGQSLLDFCIRKTYIYNDLDDMELCLDYMRKHKYAYHLLKEIDKKENLNFFKFGLEYTIKKYKERLYKSFYKLLKNYDVDMSTGCGNVLETLIDIYGDTIFYKMTVEHNEYLSDDACN